MRIDNDDLKWSLNLDHIPMRISAPSINIGTNHCLAQFAGIQVCFFFPILAVQIDANLWDFFTNPISPNFERIVAAFGAFLAVPMGHDVMPSGAEPKFVVWWPRFYQTFTPSPPPSLNTSV